MGYQQSYAPPQQMEPPEVQSIKSMLHIARILAIIFGIILLLAGLAYIAITISIYDACAAIAGNYCGGALAVVLIFPILILIWGVIDFIIYTQMKEIEALVNQHKFEQAKSKTLIWMILGFILGGLLIGIILLIAYLKFDPVISWQRNQGGAPPAYGAPPGAPGAPPPMAPPPAMPPPQAAPPMAAPAAAAAPAASAVPNCTNCGRPTTYIAQYGRYYCYSCSRYV
jgi:hypothetical protein